MNEYELCGFSLFETFLARKGCFWRLENHWLRLAASAAQFGMELSDKDRFFKEICAYHDATRDEVLRYTLMQLGGRWAGSSLHTESRLLKKAWSSLEPVPVRLYLEERQLPVRDTMRCHKSGSRMLYQARFHEARSRGYDDCLFMDSEGYLLESSIFNICALKDNVWCTPPLARGLLPGVVRAWLIDLGVCERDLRLVDLDDCQGVLATNAVKGIIPVSAIGRRMFRTDKADAFIEEMGQRDYTRTQYW